MGGAVAVVDTPAEPSEGIGRSALPLLAVRWVLLVVAAKCALNFAFADRYGWQRDELYYAVAGRHLQGGYVEFRR